jgi:dTDP-glucose 4,6-dehydratase
MPQPQPAVPFRHAVVTGGAGFLGSHLCERLLAAGTRVTCMDDLSTSDGSNVAHLRDDPCFAFVRHDVSTPFTTSDDVDLVLHLASPASPADYLRLPVETLRVGSAGTGHALEAARRTGARMVLASTSETYGDPQVHPQPESYWGHVNPVGPRGVYDEAKRFGEALTTAYRSAYGVDTAIVRIFNTYGPRMRRDDGRAIPTFIAQALTGQPMTVAGDGSQTRSVCYVDDTVRGILAVAGSDLPGPFNVGLPEERSVLDIARAVAAVVGVPPDVEFVGRPVDDPSVRCPDITAIRTRLGWEPEVGLAEGLARAVAWFRSTAPAGAHSSGGDPGDGAVGEHVGSGRAVPGR